MRELVRRHNVHRLTARAALASAVPPGREPHVQVSTGWSRSNPHTRQRCGQPRGIGNRLMIDEHTSTTPIIDG